MTPGSAGDLDVLRDWAALTVLDEDTAAEAAEQLQQACARTHALAGTSSGQARVTAGLLEQALSHAEHSADTDCPVCGALDRLGEQWAVATHEQVERLRGDAAAADEAQRQLDVAWSYALRVAVPAPQVLAQVPPGVPGEGLSERWSAWAEAVRSGQVDEAVLTLREDTAGLVASVHECRAAAGEELARREDVWQPLAEQVAAWLRDARRVRKEAELRSACKAASDWLRTQADGLRDDRLAPLAEQAADFWRLLRQESSVELGPVRLEGAATRRRVALHVTVDGIGGTALGVMSQGELHALALALFLPRAMLPASPFRFLVVDDPVQAMDPAKVDGLARVLDQVAATHQVVVFTHDDRLPESVRRLQLPATVWQVVRRERSAVELQQTGDPVGRYLDDARALAKSELPPAVAGRVVPGLCRSAFEAACHEVVLRQRLGRGCPHAAVEDALGAAHTTNQKAALALFDDEHRGGEVLTRLNQHGRWAADAYNAVRRGVHDAYSGDLLGLVRDTERLVAAVRR